MLLMQMNHVKKSYGDRLVLDIDQLTVYKGDKIGIVGANGTGKSTLLDLLAQAKESEEGDIKVLGGISYCRQLSHTLEEQDIDMDIYATQNTFSSKEQLIKELKIDHIMEQEIISGGEKRKKELAKALAKQEAIYFLDEPTSNMDIQGTEKLIERLWGLETILLISHDRNLLNQICNSIWEVKDTKVSVYEGNYDTYVQLKQEEIKRARREYEQYTSEKQRLESVYYQKKEAARDMKKLKKGMTPKEAKLRDFLCRSGRSSDGKQKNMERSAEAVQKRISHMEVKEKPKEDRAMQIDFRLTNPPENRFVITAEDFNFSYGERQIFIPCSFRIPNKSKVGIVGENGAGKTTFLNQVILASKEGNQNGIRVVPKASIGYLDQCFEGIDLNKSVLENACRDTIQSVNAVRKILAKLLFTENDLRKKAGILSGGELMKLSMSKLFVSANNMLLLDEPTNFLDLPSVTALEKMIQEYEGTVVFVSHDHCFLNNTANSILLAENKKLLFFEHKQELPLFKQ